MEKIKRNSPEELLSKWSNMIEDRFNITDRLIQLYMAEYAEHLALLEHYKTVFIPGMTHEHQEDIKETETSTLPLALKILSKINFENKNFAIADVPYSDEFKLVDMAFETPVHISNNDKSFRIINFYDDLVKTENNLVQKIVDFINERLKTFNTVIAYDLLSSYRIDENYLRCTCRICFHNI